MLVAEHLPAKQFTTKAEEHPPINENDQNLTKLAHQYRSITHHLDEQDLYKL
jgi:hypothetical protein